LVYVTMRTGRLEKPIKTIIAKGPKEKEGRDQEEGQGTPNLEQSSNSSKIQVNSFTEPLIQKYKKRAFLQKDDLIGTIQGSRDSEKSSERAPLFRGGKESRALEEKVGSNSSKETSRKT